MPLSATAHLALLLSACSGDGSDDTAGAAPTWHQDVAPVVHARCGSCHGGDGIAFDLTHPDTAQAWASAMSAAVDEGRMPPWDAGETTDCQPVAAWAADPRPTQEERDLLRAWAQAGGPLGDAATASALPEVEPEVLPRIDDVLTPLQPYTVEGPGDDFVCFSVDPGRAEDGWLAGLQVVPGDPLVAHHALVYLDPHAESEALAGEDGWYDCFGGAGVSDADLLVTWVPGTGPTVAPGDAGLSVPAGARLVFQMHYHPADEARVDLTTIELMWHDERPEYEYRVGLIGNAEHADDGLLAGPNDDGEPEFRIPAGAVDHTETQLYELGVVPELPLVSVGAHMHYIGKAFELWVERSAPDADEPAEECVLAVPDYRYEWQRMYAYAGAVGDGPVVSSGDKLRIRCTYDNSLDHEGTRAALEDAGLDAPIDVYLGEETLDEMCIAMIGFVYKH